MIANVPNGQVILGNVMDIQKILGEVLAQLVMADPPYGDIVDEDWDEDWDFLDYVRLAQVCQNVTAEGGSIYIWGGIGKPNQRHFFNFLGCVEDETDLTLRNVITWSKKRAYGKADDYLFTREEVAWLVHGEKPGLFNKPYLNELRGYRGYNKDYPALDDRKRRTNVWTDVTEVMRNKKHECEKPERLAEIMIETHTEPGDLILDLFSGSGNASKAAQRMDRRFIAIEGKKNTFDEIVERLT